MNFVLAGPDPEPMDVVYLDFSKTFDKVPHQMLLHKIDYHGIGGNVAAWIRK